MARLVDILEQWNRRQTSDQSGSDGSGNSDSSGAGELLQLLKDPFTESLQVASVYSALGISLGFMAFVTILFSFLRPYHQAIYASRLKHADEKHAPPPIGKQPWSWLKPVVKAKEAALVEQLGMDATVFLRFINMCRNIFLVLALFGIMIMIPVNYTQSAVTQGADLWILQVTPLNVWAGAIWSQVVVAYLFDIIICGFLWWNYRKILALRKLYFESADFQQSLYSRTLMLYDLPRQARSDEGIARIIDQVDPKSSFARTVVARNAKDLPELIEEHSDAVRKLEKVLAKYLKNPAQLPAERPKCKPSKKDRSYSTYPRGQKIDAIEYYTNRITQLEVEIKEVRASIDKRGTMPYGFASYAEIAEAHNIAYAARNKHPHKATITLAPRPIDIIWTNMPLSKAARTRRTWVNYFWVTLLTIFWIAPNAMIAIFLVNLTNLGKVWPAFQTSLEDHYTIWGIVQGIASPIITSLFYLLLPVIFRRLAHRAGDQTKTGREMHVLGRLYTFFVFNNLIVFTFFSVVWSFVASVVNSTKHGVNAWDAVLKADLPLAIFDSLCNNSPFWITYLFQRQLGAAIDLSQIWPVICAFFEKTFSSPTPRELIELSAPPPFDYASYYNYFLFYVTVTLCYSGIQPLVLLATALYFLIDSYLKRYLLMYRFVTKTESGGVFWRVLFNRFIFATMLSNLVVLLICWVRSGGSSSLQFYVTIPLPFLLLGFKFYCYKTFDTPMMYYQLGKSYQDSEIAAGKPLGGRADKLAARFGHPALYARLITPIVHQRAQNLLPSVYKGRLTDGREFDGADLTTVSGYSDMYAMGMMQGNKPGKSAGGIPGIEFVSDNRMDFEYFKNRPEFQEEHGGGEVYGDYSDITRPQTPGSFMDSKMGSRPTTPMNGARGPPTRPGHMANNSSPMTETTYDQYRSTGRTMDRAFTQQSLMGDGRSHSPFYMQDDNGSAVGLVDHAAAPPVARVGPDSRAGSRAGSVERGRRSPGFEEAYNPGHRQLHTPGPSIGALGGGPQGYSGLTQNDAENEFSESYDYFRGGKQRRKPGDAW